MKNFGLSHENAHKLRNKQKIFGATGWSEFLRIWELRVWERGTVVFYCILVHRHVVSVTDWISAWIYDCSMYIGTTSVRFSGISPSSWIQLWHQCVYWSYYCSTVLTVQFNCSLFCAVWQYWYSVLYVVTFMIHHHISSDFSNSTWQKMWGILLRCILCIWGVQYTLHIHHYLIINVKMQFICMLLAKLSN